MQFRAKAPGSLMLLGEHAVLHGSHALVCAVDKHVTVTLIPRVDNKILINSELLGVYETDLKQLKIEKPFQFVLGILKQQRAKMKHGCEINITANFSDQVGFGSSAAVTVATLSVVLAWLQQSASQMEMLRLARVVVRHVQGGLGSGADVAASLSGGIVNYRMQPLVLEKIAKTCPISVWYAGFKVPTPQVIKKVDEQFRAYPALFRALQKGIGQCTLEGIKMVKAGDWQGLGRIMTIQQGLMEALGVSTPLLQNLINHLHDNKGILGAKISGSGLGDCVIGLGIPEAKIQNKNHFESASLIPVNMTLEGLSCEKA